MLVSYRWLQEYVDLPWEPEELAKKLTMSGLEVEGMRAVAPDLSGVYVGLVEKIEPHPQADKLVVCTVAVGPLGKKSIVCGAPNVAVGQKVAAALPGAVLPGGLEIKAAAVRGVGSEGMLCSMKELGLGEDQTGILVLPAETEVGAPLVGALGLDDVILDVAVYANRADCLSMLGIAREVAALTGGKVRLPAVDYVEINEHIQDHTSVTVEDAAKCPRYTAILLKDIKVGPSPLWLKLRLTAAGMRPINNVVDITNYVMLETGQPLHAFDQDQLREGRIIVRGAKQDESIVTLDGEERQLTPEMLLICDAENPKCIAGVMGGKDSEVKKETSRVLLEAANFNAQNVRRTSRTLGLNSESSARFEKGIDPNGTLFASRRAAHLLQSLAQAKVYSGVIDVNTVEEAAKVIKLVPAQVHRLLGVEIPEPEMERILVGLGFSVEKEAEYWQVSIPSYRRDLEIQADLIEEIVRIWGFDKLPASLPADTTGGGQSKALTVADQLRRVLIGAGLMEALTNTFGRRDNNERLLRFNQPMLEIKNPISKDLVAMRHSLLPGLLTAVSLNAARQRDRAALFEIGAVYLAELPLTELPWEKRRLAITLWGLRTPLNWALGADEFDFYDIKGILELLLPFEDLAWLKGENPSFHPGRQGKIVWGEEEIAVYGEIHPAVLRNFQIPNRCYGAEVDLEKALGLWGGTPAFESLPRFPAVERDLAVVVPQTQAVGEMIVALENAGGDLLQEVVVFDVYQGEPISADKKSVAFSLRFQGDRTLVDEEVTAIMQRCVKTLHSEFEAEIR
ncbi:MAG TPA: phenylalanine--tRNA ligase subunit beta [Firmicutes bacterium]|nr:phenylalanine--tRNA ligase subunit beta [Bacillota bacterium]